MQAPNLIPISIVPRSEILEPTAVAATGPASQVLARRLLRYTDSQLEALNGVAAPGVLVVLGASEALPWVDGVSYLGRDPRAQMLLVPTNVEPGPMPMEAFERAIVKHASTLAPPLGVLFSPMRIMSVAAALPIQRKSLEVWLAKNV